MDAQVKKGKHLENQECHFGPCNIFILKEFILFQPEVSLHSWLLWPMVRRIERGRASR